MNLAAPQNAVALAVPFLYALNLATIVPISLLVCVVARTDVDGAPTVLRGRTMQWLGEVSFGFYLAQLIVLAVIRTTLMHYHTYATPIGIGVVAAEFLGTLAVGWLLLVCVERPVMRRRAHPRTSSKVTSAATPSDRQRTPPREGAV